MQDYLKKDLLKIIILAAVVVVILVSLTVWDNKTGVLEGLSSRYF
ncbi:MAG TPA: hypothetical protein VJK25_02975 [Patescibacteria group bacterium]|nr:hypothetical protein [Patescibacteria group bacterium]